MVTEYPELKAVELAYAYDQNSLFSDLSFEVKAGQALQVVGDNGKGKTTLLRMLAGLLEPLNGKIFWRGVSIDQFRETYYADLIYLGHLFGLKPYLTALENLRLSVQLKGYSLEEENLFAALRQAKLEKQMHQFAYQLSAGQRQRLALARLIASPGHLWILDEPFSVLCQQGQHLMGGLIEQHLSKGGITIFTSHHRVNLGAVSVNMLTL